MDPLSRTYGEKEADIIRYNSASTDPLARVFGEGSARVIRGESVSTKPGQNTPEIGMVVLAPLGYFLNVEDDASRYRRIIEIKRDLDGEGEYFIRLEGALEGSPTIGRIMRVDWKKWAKWDEVRNEEYTRKQYEEVGFNLDYRFGLFGDPPVPGFKHKQK